MPVSKMPIALLSKRSIQECQDFCCDDYHVSIFRYFFCRGLNL